MSGLVQIQSWLETWHNDHAIKQLNEHPNAYMSLFPDIKCPNDPELNTEKLKEFYFTGKGIKALGHHQAFRKPFEKFNPLELEAAFTLQPITEDSEPLYPRKKAKLVISRPSTAPAYLNDDKGLKRSPQPNKKRSPAAKKSPAAAKRSPPAAKRSPSAISRPSSARGQSPSPMTGSSLRMQKSPTTSPASLNASTARKSPVDSFVNPIPIPARHPPLLPAGAAPFGVAPPLPPSAPPLPTAAPPLPLTAPPLPPNAPPGIRHPPPLPPLPPRPPPSSMDDDDDSVSDFELDHEQDDGHSGHHDTGMDHKLKNQLYKTIDALINLRNWPKPTRGIISSTRAFHKSGNPFAVPLIRGETTTVPDAYFDVIKKPMDLTTIRNRIDSGYYITYLQFQKDVQLVVANALEFNKGDTIPNQLARYFQNRAEEELEKARLALDI